MSGTGELNDVLEAHEIAQSTAKVRILVDGVPDE